MTPEEKIKDGLSRARLGPAENISVLNSGDWASVYKVELKGGEKLAAKVGHLRHEGLMEKEAAMLEYLAAGTEAPFPKVEWVGSGVLFLNFIENDGVKGKAGPARAGRALAGLHNITAGAFGFDEDTIFGPSRQPNPWTKSWPEFYRDHRLLYMGRIALEANRISPSVFDGLQKFAGDLKNFLPENPTPSLLHGDFWGGNILYHKGRLAAFIDPAIYYGDQEADLAFATLFGSPGPGFFEAYREIRPIAPGFEERVDIYNLWGLLFHAYWFGGGYAGSARRILNRFGY